MPLFNKISPIKFCLMMRQDHKDHNWRTHFIGNGEESFTLIKKAFIRKCICGATLADPLQTLNLLVIDIKRKGTLI